MLVLTDRKEGGALKCVLLVLVMLLSSLAFCNDQYAACELAGNSIVSRSSLGLAQVSNVAEIRITCRVPTRPFPIKPGESRYGLTVGTVVYEVSSDGSQRLVPSKGQHTGGGFADGWEFVDFYVQIPLDAKERNEEASRYVAKLEGQMKKENVQPPITEEAHQRAMERMRELVYQHRVGHFQLECQVLDQNRVIGTGVIDLEVLFKGRFSDIGLPGFSPA